MMHFFSQSVLTDCGSPAKGSDRWRWFGAQGTPEARQREDGRALRRRAAVGYAALALDVCPESLQASVIRCEPVRNDTVQPSLEAPLEVCEVTSVENLEGVVG